MYSYEKKALHCKVMSDELHKASKLAERLANYHLADYFPTKDYERDKKKLLEILSELQESAKSL